jgi:hypothetical protein
VGLLTDEVSAIEATTYEFRDPFNALVVDLGGSMTVLELTFNFLLLRSSGCSLVKRDILIFKWFFSCKLST